ncbi:MAG: Asp-tRNA(Asn)/Glu-tRNA(Gln) amidotransferase subunit GatB [Burkholderiaceae bacterium]
MRSTAPLIRGFEVVIGIETHVQLATRSKIFSGASTAFGAEPNRQACAVDLALPGTLPVMNRAAVELAIRFGLAVGAKIAPLSIFARKNYFYPDLPKGYQISQYETPVVQGGALDFSWEGQTRSVRLTRAHLEEDAGKSLHEAFEGQSGIDLNRAGTPLLEVVTEPDMRSSLEAAAYARALHALVVWLRICDGNMQEGSFRCDANVSVRRPGAPYGTRREIKNLNSFKFLQQAVDFEVQWQIDLLEDGGQVQQATVLFNAATGETRAMRSKEDAHDYRYFPDPDLPPLVIAPEWVARVRAALPELPEDLKRRVQRDYGVTAEVAAALAQSQAFAAYFEAAAKACGQPQRVANWLAGEVARRLNAEGSSIEACKVTPFQLASMIGRIADGSLSNSAARQVFEALWADPSRDVAALIDVLDASHEGEADELAKLIEAVLAENPKSVAEFRAGKEKAFNALVGQVMKASRGKAEPSRVGDLLRLRLADSG